MAGISRPEEDHAMAKPADPAGEGARRQPGRPPPPALAAEPDPVELASEESFPASDPPAYTPVSHPGKPRRPKPASG
jgi:hypothetical protein